MFYYSLSSDLSIGHVVIPLVLFLCVGKFCFVLFSACSIIMPYYNKVFHASDTHSKDIISKISNKVKRMKEVLAANCSLNRDVKPAAQSKYQWGPRSTQSARKTIRLCKFTENWWQFMEIYGKLMVIYANLR